MYIKQLQDFERYLATLIPGFEVRWKTDFLFQRLLGFFLTWFNPKYMSEYASTFYPRVLFPNKAYYEESPLDSFIVLAHEFVHLSDTKRHPIWFRFSYLLPQVLVLPLALVAVILIPYSLVLSVSFGVLALASLSPIPSPWRVEWEKRGYAMTMAVTYWATGVVPVTFTDEVVEYFTNGSYYRMSWSQDSIAKWLQDTYTDIRTGTITEDPVYGCIYDFMRNNSLVQRG